MSKITSYRKIPSNDFGRALGVGTVDCGRFRNLNVDAVESVPLAENVTFPTEGTEHHSHIQSPLTMTAGEQERMTVEDYRAWRQDAMETAKKRGVHLSQL